MVPRPIPEGYSTVMPYLIVTGAKTHQAVKDQFYGDRSDALIDPFGHMWTIATHVEDVSPEEMQRRMEASMGSQPTK